jgi:hypothetical protein
MEDAMAHAHAQGVIVVCAAGWQPQPFGAGILDAGRLCTDAAIALP